MPVLNHSEELISENRVSILEKLAFLPDNYFSADDLGGLIPGGMVDGNEEIKRYYIVPKEISSIFEKVLNDA